MSTLKFNLSQTPREESIEDEPVASFERRVLFSALQEAVFIEMLRLERRRTERSGKPFMLVLIDGECLRKKSRSEVFREVASAITLSTRATDVLGWYERDKKLGLLMTEIGKGEPKDIDVIMQRLASALEKAISPEVYRRLIITYCLYPEAPTEEGDEGPRRSTHAILCPDISSRRSARRGSLIVKRCLDVVGCVLLLMLSLPAFAVIALLVKLSSPGPILFRQTRLGKYGRHFTFLKFRTMYTNNDPAIHREYVSRLIAGHKEAGQGDGTYKLRNDPRVTPVGRFLRKSSLDELPQLLNVLLNDMSLVGPRPPLPYEYRSYQTWHRRRVLEMKPGLTGLWQVEGRSRTTFEEMVRIDLRYAASWSLWTDLKILLRTPQAVFTGRGAC
jgi:lipopolysaccharide/colanic/teichoic acid biosynthesis glycosyltransferase